MNLKFESGSGEVSHLLPSVAASGKEPGSLPVIEIYTDGGCEGNPGRGGFGVVLLHPKKRREESGGFRLTTNNRMELSAAIRGLELLKEPCEVRLYSDSNYLVKSMKLGWARGWKKRGWRRKTEPVPNADLWDRLLTLCAVHKVEFMWVRGHNGNRENERCDVLCGAAMRKSDLPVDEGYERARAEKAQVASGKGAELFGEDGD